jgi:hypothetical protein
MTEEERLIEKLRLIEALYAGAATLGERQAAANARDRIRARLREQQTVDPPIEFRFKLNDPWSRRLLTALLRRYQIRPYRYPRQHRNTVMARVPKRFMQETLWPEFEEISRTLTAYLDKVTERVIAEAVEADRSEVEVQCAPPGTGANGEDGMGFEWGERRV